MVLKEIKDFPNYYASDEGDIYSNKRNNFIKLKPAVLTSYTKKNKIKKQYYIVGLSNNGKRYMFLVYRLIAVCFIKNDNIEEKNEIDHIDGNSLNNNINNLRWVTTKENANNPITLIRKSNAIKGKNHPMYKKHFSKESIEKMSKSKIGKIGNNK